MQSGWINIETPKWSSNKITTSFYFQEISAFNGQNYILLFYLKFNNSTSKNLQ